MEAEELFNDSKRTEELKDAFHHLFILGLTVVGYAGIVVVLVRIWHLVAPPAIAWLTEASIQSIDKVLFSGAIGGMLGRHMDKVFTGPGKERSAGRS